MRRCAQDSRTGDRREAGGAIGEATGTPYAPSAGCVQQLDRAVARADEELRAGESFHATQVAGYREALRAAGFEPLGGG